MRALVNFIFAIIVSLILWWYAKIDREYTINYKLPVEYFIAAKGLTLLEGPDTVLVSISGKGSDLIRFKLSHPKLYYTLDGSKVSGTFEINNMYLVPNLNVKITPILPKNIRYRLDEIAKKTLPVSPTIKGKPRIGYIYLGWMVEENVIAEGPKTVLMNLDSIPTYPIDITGKVRDFDVYAHIFTEGLNLKVNPESVKVRILIDSISTKYIQVILEDTVLTLGIKGPTRIIQPINSLRGERIDDSLYIPLPENVVLLRQP